MKIQRYYYIVLSLIVSVIVMMMSGRVVLATPKAWVKIFSNTIESLNSIWGTSATDIFVVGSGGIIFHYDGNSWTPMTSNTTEWLSGVWGSTSDEVFTVGSSGTIFHYDGISWIAMNSGTTENLYGIWGLSADEVFTVGKKGTILYYNSGNWSTMTSNTLESLRGIWGSSSTNIFVVGSNGTILRYDGGNWISMISNTTTNLYGVWGSADNNVFAVGKDGTILHYDGNTNNNWIMMTSNTTEHLYSIWGSANDNIFAVGLDTSLHYDGSDWTSLGTGTSNNYLSGIWGTDCTECDAVFAVSQQSKIFQLAPVLTINKAGNGIGTVTATAGLNSGIDCDITCKEYYPLGNSVDITAIPDSDSNFISWSGDCSGTDNPLTVTMDTSLDCTATFDVISHTLSINKTGNGMVTGSGIDCGTICSQDYPQGTAVTLTATPLDGSTFADWSDDCSSSSNPVDLTIEDSISCTANFNSPPPTQPIPTPTPNQKLTVKVTGRGKVSSEPSGINSCKNECTHSFDFATPVTLNYQAEDGWEFDSWQGDCDRNGSVRMRGTRQCEAVFMIKISEELKYLINELDHVRIIYRYFDSTKRGTRSMAAASPTSTCSQMRALISQISSLTLPISLSQVDLLISTISPLVSQLSEEQIQLLISQIESLILLTSPPQELIESLISQLSSLTTSEPCGFETIPHLVQTVNEENLNLLRQERDIASIEIDRPLFPADVDDEQVLGLIGANSVHALGYLGEGQTVAILDTGVDEDQICPSTNTDCVVASQCFSAEDNDIGSVSSCLENNSGHGTKVAKRVLAVAPQAKIIDVKVFSRVENNQSFCEYWTGQPSTSCSFAFTSDLIYGLEYVAGNNIDHPLPPDIQIASINLSLAAAQRLDNIPDVNHPDPSSYQTFSGNCDAFSQSGSFVDAITTNFSSSSPALLMAAGNNGNPNRILWPSCIPEIFSIGATTGSDNNEQIAPYSNNAGILDLLAPEFETISSTPYPSGGTSMATAYVSGAWAVLKAADTNKTKDDILNILKDTGKLITDDRPDPLNNNLPTNRVKPRIRLDLALLCPTASPSDPDDLIIESNQTLNQSSVTVVDTLCILPNGTLQALSGSDLTITAYKLYNYGNILGSNGKSGYVSSNNPSIEENRPEDYIHAENGGNVIIQPPNPYDRQNEVVNGSTGKIKAGRGGDDITHDYILYKTIEAKGGNGGSITITARIVTNDGIIGPERAPYYDSDTPLSSDGGNGGIGSNFAETINYECNGNQPIEITDGGPVLFGTQGYNDGDATGGNGGQTLVDATFQLINNGRISSGYGGDGRVESYGINTVCVRYIPTAGTGGSNVTTSPNLQNSGAIIAGGDGRALSEPEIMLSGSNMRYQDSKEVVIFGGNNWKLELRDLSPGAITAQEKITLAVGPGGIIDLRNNPTQIMKAGQLVQIFSDTDTILLDPGITLKDLIDAPRIETYPNKILYEVVVSGSGIITSAAGTTVPVNIMVLNSGPKTDTYTLDVSDSAGWQLSSLPKTITVEGLQTKQLNLEVTLPTTPGAKDIITTTVTSHADPTVKATSEVHVTVEGEDITMTNNIGSLEPATGDNQNAPVDIATVNSLVDDNPISNTSSDNNTNSDNPTANNTNGDNPTTASTSNEITIMTTTPETNHPTATATNDENYSTIADNHAVATTVVTLPFPTIPYCPTTGGTIDWICNNHHQVLADTTLTTNSSVAGGEVAGTVNNQGLISNITLLPGAQIQGGKLTGYIFNQGILTDIEFVGAWVKGGIVAGTIANHSQIGGTFQDVQLAENTVITGGYVAGHVEGVPHAPARLEDLTVKTGSTLSHVILGDNVVVADGVTLGEGVQIVSSPPPAVANNEETAALPKLGEALAINIRGKKVDALTQFAGGISINGKPYVAKVTQHLADSVAIDGEIIVDPIHIAQSAKIVVYAGYQPLNAPPNNPPLYFMRNDQGKILSWDENLTHLQPYQTVILEPIQAVNLYQGQFMATGILNLFFGYQLSDDTVVQNVQPLEVIIEE